MFSSGDVTGVGEGGRVGAVVGLLSDLGVDVFTGRVFVRVAVGGATVLVTVGGTAVTVGGGTVLVVVGGTAVAVGGATVLVAVGATAVVVTCATTTTVLVTVGGVTVAGAGTRTCKQGRINAKWKLDWFSA